MAACSNEPEECILALILGISTAYKLARGPVSMTLLTLLCTGLYFAGLCLLALNGLAFFAIAYQHILGLLA